VLEAPVDREGRLVLPPTGEGGLMVWRAANGLLQAPVAVLATVRSPSPNWWVQVTGSATRCQRRSFVRVDIRTPVIADHKGEQLTGLALDVSEGGTRCRFPGELSIRPGDSVQVQCELPGIFVDLPAEVMRVHITEDHESAAVTELGLRFSTIGLRDADNIRAFVFAEQRRLRARGLA
jgi:c-di-GMP-binding flagellar brake protein YcgR